MLFIPFLPGVFTWYLYSGNKLVRKVPRVEFQEGKSDGKSWPHCSSWVTISKKKMHISITKPRDYGDEGIGVEKSMCRYILF